MDPRQAVSLIIPTYNRAALLRRALASAFAQTRPVDEVLVVDDGSTDETAAAAAAVGDRIRYLRQPNQGVAAARNLGIREARGDFIAFLDADDQWEPQMLEMQLRVLEALPQVDWSASNMVVVTPSGEAASPPNDFERAVPVFRAVGVSPSEWFKRHLEETQVPGRGGGATVYHGDAYEMLFHGNFVFPSGTVLRRSVVEKTGGFDDSYRRASDVEFFHRVAARHRLAVIMTPLFRYTMGGADAITASVHAGELIDSAIRSIDAASRLRRPLSASEARAYRDGRKRLLLRKAYTHVTNLELPQARSVLRDYGRNGGPVTPWTVVLRVASLAPTWVLRLAGRVKRRFSRRGARV